MTASATAVDVFDRIVCGVDGTSEALEAARQAARIRSAEGLLRLVAVAEVDTAVHAGFAMSRVLDELDASARAALHTAIDTVHPDSTHLVAGAALPSLLREIERADATLVAVGPHGHSRAAGMLLGGVATTLLHDAPCSVLLGRRGRLGPFPASILAGVDGSPESLAAAAAAQSLAERFDAEFLALTATGGKPVEADAVQDAVSAVVYDERKPVEALVDLAAEADLLVLGSRGLHGLRALGSVSERVAHRAPCSVLVVRETTGSTT
ncbi:MAG TPA: universal stress protein [Gaiellaceae bacterium]|jgi:nucleotide-binding universal stress UspA family protein|nr:universal stress protein [Gaiellaceae bacterium]